MASNTHSVRYWKLTVLAIVVMVASFFTLKIFISAISHDNESSSTQFPLLAHRLFEPEHDDMIINFTELREALKKKQADSKLPLGIYFEYLPTGSSIGVNDQFEVGIGSLSKVPAVIAVYKQIENNTMNLDQVLTIEEKNLDSFFGDLWKKGAGTKLSVREAIDYTLMLSDNTAAGVLAQALPDGALIDVFDQLDLPKTRTGPFPVMSPKSYASVFRNLYLSSYLTNEHSNYVLEMLAQSKYNDKLPAGLPTSVKMSHKIGVFAQKDGKNIYNDCGIVYATKRPYILCIMSATDEQTAREEMIVYSKMVYSYVSQITTSK